MQIDTSKIKSNHWSELLLQIKINSNYSDCYDYARTVSYQEFWDNSPRGDWLLLFAANEGSTPHKLIVKAACQCARLVLPYVKQGELRPLKAIETTERWLEDKATIEEVKLAADATYHATSYATYTANATYAANASYAASFAAADCASIAAAAAFYASATDAAVKKEMQQKTADIVRSIIPIPTQAVSEFERLVKMKAFW